MAAGTFPTQDAVVDRNNYPAHMLHTGTAGTADLIRATGQTNGAQNTHITGGTVTTALGESTGGTLDIVTRIGNIGTIESGTVTTTLALNTGTITTGSLANIGQVHNAGTIAALPDLPGGTLDAGTVVISAINVDVPGGTTDLVTAVTTVNNLTNGSVNLLTGTVTSVTNVANLTKGTITELEGGTLDLVSQANVTVGTFSADVPGGTVDLVSQANVTVGTFSADVPGGTVDLVSQANVTVGTFSADIPGGTIDRGTVQNLTVPTGSVVQSVHVLGTGGTIAGTLLGPQGAGTSVYLTGLQVVGHSGTCDYAVANNVAGSTGAGVYARGIAVPGGGFGRDFSPAINMGANGTITYFVNGNGTASFVANYIVST